ncbi:MAG: hypothetical protein GY926_21420 [bacterium]|nr:hypothetical protein [bacterium]MCP4967780.1 hypothetical protein [bacterium]
MSAPPNKIIAIAASAICGGVVGWLIGSSLAWGTIGAVVGLGVSLMTLVYGVRPLVAAPVGIGAGVGAYLGGTIVEVICEPKGCPAFEAVAATTTGIGALVGIGLVVALATRSFDEYQDAVARGAQAPTTRCSSHDQTESD